MKKILLFLILLIPCMSFANDGIIIYYTDGACQGFGAEHSSTTLSVHTPGTFWAPCDGGRWPTDDEWVIYDSSFFDSSAKDSREDFDRLVQVIKESGHSAAINEYWTGNNSQAIYLNVEKVTRV